MHRHNHYFLFTFCVLIIFLGTTTHHIGAGCAPNITQSAVTTPKKVSSVTKKTKKTKPQKKKKPTQKTTVKSKLIKLAWYAGIGLLAAGVVYCALDAIKKALIAHMRENLSMLPDVIKKKNIQCTPEELLIKAKIHTFLQELSLQNDEVQFAYKWSQRWRNSSLFKGLAKLNLITVNKFIGTADADDWPSVLIHEPRISKLNWVRNGIMTFAVEQLKEKSLHDHLLDTIKEALLSNIDTTYLPPHTLGI